MIINREQPIKLLRIHNFRSLDNTLTAQQRTKLVAKIILFSIIWVAMLHFRFKNLPLITKNLEVSRKYKTQHQLFEISKFVMQRPLDVLELSKFNRGLR